MNNKFDEILEIVCDMYEAAWWEVVDGPLCEDVLIPMIANQFGNDVVEMNDDGDYLNAEFGEWFGDLMMEL